jgi:hypothetical protein
MKGIDIYSIGVFPMSQAMLRKTYTLGGVKTEKEGDV